MPVSDRKTDPPTVWIAHVDLDAFYTSCEQRDHPEYRDRPVVVGALPGKRGVVAAASYEARVFGIHSAMPISDAFRRCPDAVYLRPNMSHYVAESRRIFEVLKSITPVIEKASIDEAYLDVTGLEKLIGPPAAIGRAIKQRIYKETELTASVGIGPNRLIAKLGSEHDKPDGLTVVAGDQVLDFLAPMPVANLRGVGKKTQQIFKRLKINTVAELRAADPAWLADHLGQRHSESVLRQAVGRASDKVVPGRARKQISKEHTFQADLTSIKALRDQLRELAQGVAHTARAEHRAGRVVRLKVRFADFETLTRQKSLATPTHDERVLLATAWKLFTHGDLPQKPVRLIGVGLSDWAETETAQPDLFASPTEPTDEKLLDTIDRVTERFGKDKLQLGVSGSNRSS